MSGAISAVLSGGGLANMILGLYPPLPVWYNRKAFAMWQTMVPSLSDLIELRKREWVTPEHFHVLARENGWPDKYAEALFETSRYLLTPYEYLNAYWRGQIDETTLRKKLENIGMSIQEIEIFKRTSEYFPPTPDLVRFAVREVYSPAIRERFKQDEDRPQQFLDEAKKAGLPEEQAKNYWAAHWELPSINQGFDMLHREAINESDLDLLLKALDVMPFWREALKKISYNPYTRVDTRRMYGMGILDEAGVYRSYKDQGYDDEHAKNLTAFTIKYESDELEGISRANVVAAYKIGLIDESRLRLLLKSFGLSELVVDFWVDVANYELAKDKIENEKHDLILLYRKGGISLEEVKRRLAEKNVPQAYVDRAVEQELTQSSYKAKVPTKADAERWFKLGIIDEKNYADRLSALGYAQTDIHNYLQELELEGAAPKRRYLPDATYQRWVTSGIMSADEFITVMTAKGVSEDDIYRLLLEAGEEVESAT